MATSFSELRKHKFKINHYEQFKLEPQSKNVSFDKEHILKIHKELKKRSEFLNLINLFPVKRNNGEKIIGPLVLHVTGRQETRHRVKHYHNEQGYNLVETDSGCSISWQFFDIMSENYSIQQLEEIHDDFVLNQIASDMIHIGWHGQSIAPQTKANDLSDVNKGWLTKLKEQKSTNLKTKGQQENGKIKIFGENADYKNLDELAKELRKMLDTKHQNRTDLIFFVGADLIEKSDKPLLGVIDSQPALDESKNVRKLLNQFGGLPTITPPNFPSRGAVVTTLKNLSIYTGTDNAVYSMREDEESKSYITSYWRNEDYIVEDLGLMSAIAHENVVLGE